jgi:integrase
MSNEWREWWTLPENAGIVKEEHIYGLGGLRKSWATLQFAKELKKWGQPDIALQMVSKQMKHSCKEMTAHHYIKNFDLLEIHKYVDMDITEILRQPLQTKINNYLKHEEKPLVIY